ncbi:MAG TPA: hypothetical protein VK639_03510 [Terriglobales bacterium]|nr:hypothetical protein [Terriglobales bacterium]
MILQKIIAPLSPRVGRGTDESVVVIDKSAGNSPSRRRKRKTTPTGNTAKFFSYATATVSASPVSARRLRDIWRRWGLMIF